MLLGVPFSSLYKYLRQILIDQLTKTANFCVAKLGVFEIDRPGVVEDVLHCNTAVLQLFI